MANIDQGYFLALFDEFKKVDVNKLTVYLDLASMRVPATVWGDATKYATALLTAHMLTASGRQGAGPTAGALTQESVGDLSRTFESNFEPGAGDALLRTTRYGIDFVELRRETISCAMTTRGATPRPFC